MDYQNDQFKELRDYIDERTRDMETHLLSEFRKWALRIEASIKPQPARIAGLEDRVSLVEERLDNLDNERTQQ
jgi:hypothetical protein